MTGAAVKHLMTVLLQHDIVSRGNFKISNECLKVDFPGRLSRLLDLPRPLFVTMMGTCDDSSVIAQRRTYTPQSCEKANLKKNEEETMRNVLCGLG